MPHQSPLPPFTVPPTDLYTFLFSRSTKPFPSSHIILRDPTTNRTYSWQETKDAALTFGQGLKSQWQWRRGDVLALFAPNCIDTPAIMWGTHWAGGVITPVNPAYTAEELAFQLKDSGARAVVTQWGLVDVVREAVEMVGSGLGMEVVVLMGDERDQSGRVKHFTSVRNVSGASRYRKTRVDPGKDLAFLPYSSGTTGRPKGVMLTHRNVVSNTLQNHLMESTHLRGGGADGGDGDKLLGFLPFFHIYGLTVLIHQCFWAGYELVVMPRYDLEGFCDIVQCHRITMAYVAPPVVLQLSKSPVVERYDLSSLRMMNSGAAPLTAELVDAVWNRLRVPVKQGYGLTETSPTTHAQPWERWRSRVGSCGVLLPNQTAKFVDGEGKEVEEGGVGELWIQGPNVFQGYLNNPEGTAEALTADGFFKTGDVGYVDEEGNFYITDRLKELIKYKGFQVPPAELEGKLASHPMVNDVCVIGVYDAAQVTELPRAYVVLKEGQGSESEETATEIVEWVKSRVANHKQLRGGVRFVKEIPKSASGKILRRVLKQQMLREGEALKAKL